MALKRTVRHAAGAVARTDAKIERFFLPHRDSRPVKAIELVAKLGDQPPLRLISAAFIGIGWLASDRRLVRTGLRMLLAHETATLAKNFAKDEVDRKRPGKAASMRERTPRPGRSSRKEETSFPSGHTAGSLAVASAFSREYPDYRTHALIAAGLVAGAQIPRCAHYLTDVGAGAVVGLLSEAATNALWRDSSNAGDRSARGC